MVVGNLNYQINGILNAVFAGFFIYIGVVEMLGHEFPTKKYRDLKVLTMLIGGGLMVGLYFLEEIGEEGE